MTHQVLNAATTSRRPPSSPRPGARRGDHRHQHGRPRHRHPAGRQPGDARPIAGWRGSDRGPQAEAARKDDEDPSRRTRRPTSPRSGEVVLKSYAEGGLFVLGTERHESRAHRQPAARPLRPSGRSRHLALLPVAGGRPDAHLRLRAHGQRSCSAWGWSATRPSSIPGSTRPWRRRSRRSRRATSRSARTCCVRRRHERPAQGDLRASARRLIGRRRGQRAGHRDAPSR